MWRLAAPDWLVARPIAHRGLHDATCGIIENTIAAARGAIEKNYAIECDVQASADGEAIVFHDDTLARLLGRTDAIAALNAHEIARLAYPARGEPIATLPDFLAAIGGRVPLIVEIKSRFDGDMRLAARVAALAQSYTGPLALKAFDPQTLCALRRLGAKNPLGLVAQANYAPSDWPELSDEMRKNLAALVDFPIAEPDFLSWHVGDLPHAVPRLCRAAMGMKVMVWTVRSAAERARAMAWADQIVFEGFQP